MKRRAKQRRRGGGIACSRTLAEVATAATPVVLPNGRLRLASIVKEPTDLPASLFYISSRLSSLATTNRPRMLMISLRATQARYARLSGSKWGYLDRPDPTH
ncbi:hypothetical protein B296_00009118 [Ensete ventricosum]|uniref:Uncharacterized protein n=1 Tax=Ensete ventricosum TaxID=4639 RepID=A0A427B1V4_ENSVE|nr:hypothetical protein B296_00009118 [Ensete ventricosum]